MSEKNKIKIPSFEAYNRSERLQWVPKCYGLSARSSNQVVERNNLEGDKRTIQIRNLTSDTADPDALHEERSECVRKSRTDVSPVLLPT